MISVKLILLVRSSVFFGSFIDVDKNFPFGSFNSLSWNLFYKWIVLLLNLCFSNNPEQVELIILSWEQHQTYDFATN